MVDLGVPSRRTRFRNLIGLFVRIFRLTMLLYRSRPWRILSFMESANIPVLIAALICGMARRTRVSVRNNPAAIKRRYRVVIPWLYRISTGIVVPSDGVGSALVRRGLPARKLAVIPNPIAKTASSSACKWAPYPAQYILGVGRLVDQKQFELLIEAFSKIDAPEVRLVILGSGPKRERLKALASALGIGPRVVLHGTVSSIYEWYRCALCFVLTSRYEGWPNVLVEAMANGCPVISVDCRYGPSEILEGGRHGVLVRQGDMDGLTGAIRAMLADPSLRLSMALRGKRRAHAFQVSEIARIWLA